GPRGPLGMRAASIHLCSSLLVLGLFAQASVGEAAAIVLGLKGGLSAATLRGHLPTDPYVPHSTRFGFGGGVSAAFGVSGRLAFQPELNYVQKGTSLGDISETDANGNVTGKAHVALAFDYLELPLLARISFP